MSQVRHAIGLKQSLRYHVQEPKPFNLVGVPESDSSHDKTSDRYRNASAVGMAIQRGRAEVRAYHRKLVA